jgi:FkbM family methyltransferase
MMKILYGVSNSCIDVTDICIKKMSHNLTITIPSGDANRAYNFTDPVIGVHKKIFVVTNNFVEYDEHHIVKINMVDFTVTGIYDYDTDVKISLIHSNLKLKYGIFSDELPEQKITVRQLKGHEKVLEIGGNIGRNSLVISSILHNSNNLVTLECDPNIANKLRENRDINNFEFHIETSALSKKKLIQRGMDTIQSDVLLNGYTPVNIISLEELKNKYNIVFDTLVLDCEGAFYYILMDMPEILENINMIIMENDYGDINHKKYVDQVLTDNDFYCDYVEPGGWDPCFNNFYEVWKRVQR